MPLDRIRNAPPADAADMIDQMFARGLSMVRILRSAEGRRLLAIVDECPTDFVEFSGTTTREVIDRLWARYQARAAMVTLPDTGEQK